MDPFFAMQKEFVENVDLSGYDPEYIAKITGLELQEISDFVSPKRKYIVQSNQYYGFLAGANANKRPTILFCSMDFSINIVSIEDDKPKYSSVKFPEGTSWEKVEEDTGFIHAGDAPMHSFKHPDIWDCAILPFPMHLHEAAVGESKEDDDIVSLKEWIQSKNFILYWRNDYFLNAEGEVTSS